MSWFKCDNDGNILLNMNNILKILQNTSVPDIEKIQTDILSAIQNIKSISASGEISQEQLNLILSAIQAIPSDTIVDNQNVMIDTLNTTKSNTNDIKSILDIVNNVSEESIIGTLKAGKTSITLKNNNIKEDTGVEVYTSIYNVNPTAIFTTDGSITLTFDKQNIDMDVKVIFKRNLNWNDIPEKFVTIVDGVIQTKNIDFKLEQCVDENKSTLPYQFREGSAVVLNNEIHIMGGEYNSIAKTNHYKYDGSTWTNVSTLPYQFYNGSAVIYNNEIHILGSSGDKTKHYKYDGSTWTNVSTLPYNFYEGSAVVLNNEIHILGSGYNSSDRTKHYKYDGSTWTNVSTLPYLFNFGSTVVYNNEIHILSSYDSSGGTSHYKYDGSSWSSVSTLPYSFYRGRAVVLNNEIHILGGGGGGSDYTKHYKYDGSTWSSVSTLPYNFHWSSAVVYNNEIHILGTEDSSSNTKHYIVAIPLYKKLN